MSACAEAATATVPATAADAAQEPVAAAAPAVKPLLFRVRVFAYHVTLAIFTIPVSSPMHLL